MARDGGDAVEHRHQQVHQDHVRARARGACATPAAPSLGLAHHLDVVLQVEERAQPAPDDLRGRPRGAPGCGRPRRAGRQARWSSASLTAVLVCGWTGARTDCRSVGAGTASPIAPCKDASSRAARPQRRAASRRAASGWRRLGDEREGAAADGRTAPPIEPAHGHDGDRPASDDAARSASASPISTSGSRGSMSSTSVGSRSSSCHGARRDRRPRRQVEAVREVDEPRQALAHASVGVDHEHAHRARRDEGGGCHRRGTWAAPYARDASAGASCAGLRRMT